MYYLNFSYISLPLATDIGAQFIAAKDPNEEKDSFVQSYELLLERGGKKYEEIYPDSPHILSLKKSKDYGDEFDL